MELYSRDISPYAARARISILAKDLPVRIVDNPDVGSTEFGRLSPLRRVPVLVLGDGTALPESDTIVEYLEDTFPDVPLRPTGALARARVRLIARVAELYVFPACLPLFGALGDPEQLDGLFDALHAALTQLSSLLDRGSRSWHAFGGTLTTADGALTPFLWYVQFLGSVCERPVLVRHPELERFWSGAQSHPVLSTVTQQMAAAMTAASGR